jgi:hypothetical protein
LANVYLHVLDTELATRGVGELVRYADLCGIPHKSAYADWRIVPTVA